MQGLLQNSCSAGSSARNGTAFVLLLAYFFFNLKKIVMAQVKGNREQGNRSGHEHGRNESIGKQQGTAQTGAQNNGGENIDREEDQYTEDLRQSGQRKSRDEDRER